MMFYDSFRLPDKTVTSAADLPYPSSSASAAAARKELVFGDGPVHAPSGRPSRRGRRLLLVDPSRFERACRALGVDGDGSEIVFGLGQEPESLRVLLGAGLRDIVEPDGVRGVLIAPSGQGAEEQMLEVTVDRTLETAAVSTPRLGLTSSAQLVKRGFDLVVAGVAMLFAVPLFAVIGLLVELGSPGPVLFRQARVGRGGRQFEMLKFRTMVEDAEARKGQLLELNERDGLFKIREDPRVTPVGRWLRRTNLDELPQLINVLRGEMSLVGPRPLVPEEDVRIRGWRRRRLDVSPGMTGAWQLGTPRVSLDEMIVLDHLYTANWSLWRDVKCLLGTVPSIVLRRGL
jgi:lipopolysaccharide/colanic/teichoic acid biosynthesis glycosyltransferase